MDKAVSRVLKIIDDLDDVPGLYHAQILDRKEKELIMKIESKRNLGVAEAISRKYTVCVFHDSSFREPAGEIVSSVDGKRIYPGVPFPEVKARGVVSSSPGRKVHSWLRSNLYKGMTIPKGHASLLIGFDV